MDMQISRDAIEIAALFALLVGIFVGAGLIWWALFILAVGVVLLAFEWYLWTHKGETLSQQFWRLWREKPKLATALWVILLIALGIIVLHLKR
jgi:hypothetical protein